MPGVVQFGYSFATFEHQGDAMVAVLAIVAFVAMWAVVAVKGKQKGWPVRQRQLLGVGAGIAAMAFVIAVGTAPAPTEEPRALAAAEKEANPESAIRSIDPEISNVEVYPQASGAPLLLITYTDKTIWSDGAWMSGTGLALEKILGAIVKENPNAYSRVQVKFMVPTVDKYGNKSSEFAMRTEHAMSELRKVNWDNSTAFMMLDLADAEIKPLGLNGFRDYCAEHGEYSTAFCARAR